MTEISFYHLTKTDFRKALPSLLEKVLSSGKRAVLLAANEERLQEIDNFLWTFSTKRFIPHGNMHENFKEDQPIYLTTIEENPNNADILVLVDGQQTEFVKAFSRTLDVFDGNNEQAVSAARTRWQAYKDQSIDLTYWKQSEKGSWEQG